MYYEEERNPERDFNNQLRMELGWGDVAGGLSKVLFGYGILFAGTFIGLGLVLLSMFELGDEVTKDVGKKVLHPKATLGSLWALYAGLGILSVIGLISYCIILGGQFRCMMGAADRHGARWMMFLCIACVFLGPAFHFASGVSNWQQISELKNHPQRVENFQLNPLGQWLQLIGLCISMLYPLFFTLFLRAIGVCLRVEWHVIIINIFLVVAGLMVGATAYAMVFYRPGAKPIPALHATALGLGWVGILVIYVALIAVTRVVIYKVRSQVKSPLEMGIG
jgi:hypothetical protein